MRWVSPGHLLRSLCSSGSLWSGGGGSYVRLNANDYSVHPTVIGRRVEVAADLEQVTVTCQGATRRPASALPPFTRLSPTRPTPTAAAELRARPGEDRGHARLTDAAPARPPRGHVARLRQV